MTLGACEFFSGLINQKSYSLLIQRTLTVAKFFLFLLFLFTDCESLIRKMLVLDPTRRFTIEQIKRHRWMTVEDSPVIKNPPLNSGGTACFEPNDTILRIMQGIGIDSQKTRKSLKVSNLFSVKSQ